MILLNGHSLTPVRRLYLEGQSLTLNERESVSDLSTTDTDGITMNSWLQDETDPGAGIVWRVRSIKEEFATGTTTVQLEHIINVLRDKLLFGEIKADTITGVTGATTCTAQQAVNYILAQQSDWTLYSFDYASVTNAYTFDGDSLYDALVRVTETLDDAYWSYDTTVYPFRLSITEKPAGTACEMRPGRNLVSVNRSIDRGGMYTRFYPIGKDDLHIPGNYVDKNTNLYGIVSHVEMDTSRESVADLTAWANERLKRHAEPQVTTTADGLEIAEATGEPLDRLTLMRICRMPLPEYGTTIEERITELTYRDKIHEPTVVRITMGNQQEDIVKLIAREIKEGAGPSGSGRGGGGRGGARQEREDHAWFEDTDEHVAMCAEGIVGVDAQGNPNWTLLSQIIVDGTGVHQSVTEVKEDLVTAEASIEMNQNAITAEVTRATGAESALSGRITVEAGKITQIVTAVGDNGQVTAASIVAAVNNAGSSVTISADVIDLDGIVEGLTAYDVEVNSLDANDIYCSTTIQSNSFSFEGGNLFTNCIVSATKSLDGNTLTLTDAYGDTVTFNKATTLTGDWSGSYQAGKKYVVVAKQNGVQVASNESPTVNSVAKYGSPTWASDEHSFDQQILVQDADANSIYLGSINVTGITKGTFTLASVTLQGSQVSGTCYHTVPTGGTVYYTAGSSVTRLGSSVTPTSVSGYRRGSSVSMSRDTIYRKGTGGTYSEIGYCYYCQSSAGASTLYKGGDYFSYYDVGTSSTLYYAGSSVTPISGGGVRLSTVTAYTAGSTVTDTYYTKS